MNFIRRHLFLIFCAAAAALGIALLVTGLQSMPGIVEQMEKAKGVYSALNSLQGTGANQRAIDAERERIRQVQEDYDRITQSLDKVYLSYQPLVEDVFPDGRDELRRRFKTTYQEKLQELYEKLRAGAPASPAEVDLMKIKIANERQREELAAAEGETPVSPEFLGPPRTPAGVLTRAGARTDPKVRADLAAAQRIYLYAVPLEIAPTKASLTQSKSVVSALDFDFAMRETGSLDAPTLEDTWRAQLNYWIQRDIVDAVSGLNGDVADQLAQQGVDRWVGTMPVKELISIRVLQGYVPAEGDPFACGKPGDYTEALPPGTPASVFTGSGQSPTYDVVQFTLKLVMDQRYLTALIERLAKDRFHVPLRVAYRTVIPNREMTGKVYGDGPVVHAVIDFECILLGQRFRSLMPAEVCEKYGIECPVRETG